MSFAVAGSTYDRYMGRYSVRLAPLLVDFAGVPAPGRALDVGCGPGALTAELASRLGVGSVAAADPSESLAAACAERVPGADVRVAAAERLPWGDATFDAALSQLVVNFMQDPEAGVREMARVVRAGGVVAACTWEYREGMKMLRTFFDAALALDPAAPDEAIVMRFQGGEELAGLWSSAGLREVETAPLDVAVEYSSFDDYWQPFESGVGPAGAYCASLSAADRQALRHECRRRLGAPSGPFTLAARAWAVRGEKP